jgi:zinc/manganese transport system permease protein
MNFELVLDPLFRVPLVAGAMLAVLLPVLGTYLRLRGEWLAALGYTQVAAAGAMASAVLGWPVLASALLAGAGAALLKTTSRRPGNDLYVAMVVGGWAAAILIAANSHQGEVLGQTLLRGQFYFVDQGEAWWIAAAALSTALALPWLSPRLLRQRFFPDYFSANLQPAWPHEAIFALLLVWTLVLATVALGAMAAFALMFVPPWIAFRVAAGWWPAVLWSAGIGLAAYLAAFVIAIALDQPFGPVLVASLLVLTPLRGLSSLTRR